MKWYKADLHIHSVLSPCGDLEMSPDNVIQTAFRKGMDIIAITDHNSMGNSPAFRKVANRYGIFCFMGMEIQTSEEIHIVCLLDDVDKALAFEKEVYEVLPSVKNDPDYFGDQVVIDAEENIVRFEEKALINSINWTIDETVVKIREYDGFCFPAHVDAVTFSIIGQLGFIPPDSDYDALGITAKCNIQKFLENNSYLSNFAFIRNSDAHYLNDIASGFSEFYIEKPTIQELKMACKKIENRVLKTY